MCDLVEKFSKVSKEEVRGKVVDMGIELEGLTNGVLVPR
jgi:hypothetical protein